MSKIPKLKKVFTITDPETLKVIADPLRLQILKCFKNPKTVKDVADALDIVQTKLYYHVNMLEKHHLIEVVDTNIVSGIIEKKYRVTAGRYSVDEALLTASEDPGGQVDTLLSAIFDSAKDEINKSIQAGLMDLSDDSEPQKGMIIHSSYSLTDEQVEAFNEGLSALLKEFNDLSNANDTTNPDTPIYGLTFAFFPVNQPKKNN
ncbi:MAG: helix-turn-helix domain-containing protein [Candidatus Promineifilaceae bacterium]